MTKIKGWHLASNGPALRMRHVASVPFAVERPLMKLVILGLDPRTHAATAPIALPAQDGASKARLLPKEWRPDVAAWVFGSSPKMTMIKVASSFGPTLGIWHLASTGPMPRMRQARRRARTAIQHTDLPP
jgi:hypothetical protein